MPFLVPSAPADIKAVTSGESSAIVSWRAPSLANGVIQKYTVYRREIISGKEAINYATSSGANFFLTNLLLSPLGRREGKFCAFRTQLSGIERVAAEPPLRHMGESRDLGRIRNLFRYYHHHPGTHRYVKNGSSSRSGTLNRPLL